MGAYRDEKRGTWYVSLRYKDWRGESKKKMRRGFPTRREALAWEKSFKGRMAGVASMPFEDACKLYLEEVAPRLRPGTAQGKRCMFDQRIIPFFKGVALCDVSTLAVMEWGNVAHVIADKGRKALLDDVSEHALLPTVCDVQPHDQVPRPCYGKPGVCWRVAKPIQDQSGRPKSI